MLNVKVRVVMFVYQCLCRDWQYWSDTDIKSKFVHLVNPVCKVCWMHVHQYADVPAVSAAVRRLQVQVH